MLGFLWINTIPQGQENISSRSVFIIIIASRGTFTIVDALLSCIYDSDSIEGNLRTKSWMFASC